ncbi:hypothetical protein CYMTET_15481 [Cymbomonas tetramitiformis]|uniref:Uncharacterized protein n=1 Tax=Cymbomonas tetramitiformis TaxID=36881 RepID=A0AAE0GFD9_9CHLO|nr:hypothetical protein CYMTET_15481 [Cymbomonas tetramitiformis]
MCNPKFAPAARGTEGDTNLVLLGGPDVNRWSAQAVAWAERTDSSTDNGVDAVLSNLQVRIGPCAFTGPGIGAALLAPVLRPEGPHDKDVTRRLALVIAGTDIRGLRDAVWLATPTIPPMARQPFTNLFPDFVVTGPEIAGHGIGGFRAAGYWGDHWEYRPELASMLECVHAAVEQSNASHASADKFSRHVDL